MTTGVAESTVPLCSFMFQYVIPAQPISIEMWGKIEKFDIGKGHNEYKNNILLLLIAVG